MKIALLTSLLVLGGAQALAPASAAASDDEGGCIRIVNWPVIEVVKDCAGEGSGAGEVIVVTDTKPEPDRPLAGPGHDASIGGERDPRGPGPRGGGGRIEPAPKGSAKKPAKKPFKWPAWKSQDQWNNAAWWPHEECRRLYAALQGFYEDQRKLASGELSFLRWWLGGHPHTAHFKNFLREWDRYQCNDRLPTDVY